MWRRSLRNINKEYILKRVAETETLADEIADLEDTLARPQRIRRIIIDELTDVRKKYAIPRHTEIVYGHELPEEPEEEPIDDYPVHLFLSRQGYFKKITPPVPAHVRRSEVQGGRRPLPSISRPPTPPSCCSSPTASRSIRPAPASSARPRPRPWATTCLPSWAWRTARMRSIWPWPGITAASCCSF